MEACFESAYSSQIQGEKIKKQGAIRLRSQGTYFTLLILPGVVIDQLQVGGLSAQTWTVVNKLAVNFARREVDERHVLLVRTRSETYSTRAEGRPASRRLKSRIRARFYFPRNLEGQVNFSKASKKEVTLSSSLQTPCR